MAEKQNIEIYRGDSKTITVNFAASASMLLDGYVWFTMKTVKDNIPCSEPVNACVFQTNDVIVPVLAADLVTITGYKAVIYIPPAVTRAFPITSFFYDIQAIGDADQPGNPGQPALVKTLVEGKVKILEDVTIRTP